MVSVVADTHAIVWHLTDPTRLGRGARRAFAAIDSGRWLCHVPVITLVEVWLLHERGRLRVGTAQLLDALTGHPGYAILSLDVAQAVEFGTLPRIKDPLDRLILAAARATRSRLISADEGLGGHGVERLWD
jgi:PIN domain nuclease of toxin-antitoxin system